MNTKQITENRWKDAQEYERNWWLRHGRRGSKQYIQDCKIIQKDLRKYVNISRDTRVLQIGCGPEDIIHYWTPGKPYAVEPLLDYFNEIGILQTGRVKMKKGMGEKIPFSDNFFDIIVINNVLDHCRNPPKVISEIRRCLRKSGILYFRVHVRPKTIVPFLRLFWKTQLSTSRGHPFLFTKSDIYSLFRDAEMNDILNEKLTKSKFSLKYLSQGRNFVRYIIEQNLKIICRK